MEISERCNGFFHFGSTTIDADIFFHGIGHFLSDFGDGIAVIFEAKKRLDAGFGFFCEFEDSIVGNVGNLRGEIGRVIAGDVSEDEDFREGIRTETIGAMQTDAGAFAGGIKSGFARCRMDISFDASHRIMDDGTHGNGGFSGFDADIGSGKLANLRESFLEFFSAEMAQIEINDVSKRRIDGFAFFLFVPKSLRKPVPGAEIHCFSAGFSGYRDRAERISL